MANLEYLNILLNGADAWNRWRQENPGRHIDLSDAMLRLVRANGINLSDVHLYEAHLGGAYLENADLTGADLSYVNFHDAHLSRAKLKDTYLTYAILSEADLSHADLTDARLAFADISKAKLDGTILTGAFLNGTNFGDNDLSNVRGLDSITHAGPSTIGIDTLNKSAGKIPVQFLRGCGLKDWEIEATKLYSPDLTPDRASEILYRVVELRTDPLIQFYSCFISYSQADKPFARRLYISLQNRGVRCWLDERQVLPGHDVYEEVDRGIRLWDKVLLCCSKGSLRSWWVDNEINTAFAKEQQLTKDRGRRVRVLIPLDLDGYLFSKECESGKAAQIKSRLVADFTGWEADNRKFEEQFERLVRALRTDEGREVSPPARL